MPAPLPSTTPIALLAASLLVLSACAPTQERCADPATVAPAETPAAAPAPPAASPRAARNEFFMGNAREVVEKNPIGPDEKTKLVPLVENADHTVNVIQTRGTVPLHYHAEHDELVVILEGSGTFSVEGQTRVVKAGDVQVIPRGAVHSYVHEGPGVTVVVSTFSPKFDPKDRIMVDAKKP
ncbi:cupin domain-containing protein [Polyangium sp. 6x1]|uniref:cupin domain-containing protein n=1 Tax=Polyangium sp. 6x1 TaxID=3042689 RepID=UPI00248224CC|nr:cupin domain-containing protein [Polyangium sp. 6x1]MDI1445536.1 cupin domain-containing protein [Polyangium sp. 6x1]